MISFKTLAPAHFLSEFQGNKSSQSSISKPDIDSILVKNFVLIFVVKEVRPTESLFLY